MKRHFDIDFDSLFCIANMPIARFASYLKRNGNLQEYMDLLRENFNPATVEGLMCRHTINVSWEGEVYDCDFNQMMKMPLSGPRQGKLFVWEIDVDEFTDRPILTADHCFGCTAGSGSSCGGALS